MFENYGNVVVMKGTDFWESKLAIGLATKSQYHHTGLLISPTEIEVMTRGGVAKYNLETDLEKEDYGDYLIVEHRDMTPELRKELKRLNESEFFRDLYYDEKNLRKIFFRSLRGIKPDWKDLSTSPKGSFCNSRVGLMYEELGLPVKEGVHNSQLFASHFLEPKYWNIIRSTQVTASN